MLKRTLALLLPLVLAACAAGGPLPDAPDGRPATRIVDAATDTLVPPGYGTLRQEEITVSLRAGAVLVKVTPLTEPVIRIAAPDTYMRLNALRESRREEAERTVTSDPELLLVSFFSYEPDAPFQPEDVQLVSQARVFRPAAIIPLTTGWGRQRLGQQETQTAIYVFDNGIDYRQPITVRYGMVQNEDWRRVLINVENERGRILSRMQ